MVKITPTQVTNTLMKNVPSKTSHPPSPERYLENPVTLQILKYALYSLHMLEMLHR